MQKHDSWRCVRYILALIEVCIFGYERIKLFRADLLSKLLKIFRSPSDLVRHQPGHQHKTLEATIESAQERAHSRVITVADESNALRIDVSASEQHVNSAAHVDYLLKKIEGDALVQRILAFDVSGARDWSIG